MRVVIFVNCWLSQGLRSPFRPVDHLLSLQNSYSSCCSHPLPLPSFSPLSLLVSDCLKRITYFHNLSPAIFWLLILIYLIFWLSAVSLNTTHHLLDRGGSNTGPVLPHYYCSDSCDWTPLVPLAPHSCQCLTSIAGQIFMLHVVYDIFWKKSKLHPSFNDSCLTLWQWMEDALIEPPLLWPAS